MWNGLSKLRCDGHFVYILFFRFDQSLITMVIRQRNSWLRVMQKRTGQVECTKKLGSRYCFYFHCSVVTSLAPVALVTRLFVFQFPENYGRVWETLTPISELNDDFFFLSYSVLRFKMRPIKVFMVKAKRNQVAYNMWTLAPKRQFNVLVIGSYRNL